MGVEFRRSHEQKQKYPSSRNPPPLAILPTSIMTLRCLEGHISMGTGELNELQSPHPHRSHTHTTLLLIDVIVALIFVAANVGPGAALDA